LCWLHHCADCRLAEGFKLDGGRDERDILYIVSRGLMHRGRNEQSKSWSRAAEGSGTVERKEKGAGDGLDEY
jgi:hypothetical protein